MVSCVGFTRPIGEASPWAGAGSNLPFRLRLTRLSLIGAGRTASLQLKQSLAWVVPSSWLRLAGHSYQRSQGGFHFFQLGAIGRPVAILECSLGGGVVVRGSQGQLIYVLAGQIRRWRSWRLWPGWGFRRLRAAVIRLIGSRAEQLPMTFISF